MKDTEKALLYQLFVTEEKVNEKTEAPLTEEKAAPEVEDKMDVDEKATS